MRISFDTNILGYAEGLDDPERTARAAELVAALSATCELILPIQAAAELHRLVMRRGKVSAIDATAIVRRWLSLMPIHPETRVGTFEKALAIASEHHLQVFDAIILAASAEAGARMLLSEDMQDGFVWRGVTVANPFALAMHPMLLDLMR